MIPVVRRIRKHGKTTEKKTDRILAGDRIPDGEIRVCDVEKYYGSDTNITKAVDRVSFCVQKGEFVGIMGASGSGKTTLLNMLSTIDRVTAGHIYYGETDITELSDEALAEFRKDNLGFIFQDYNLLDTLTIEENIVLAMTLHSKSKREIQEKCDHILKLLDIEEIRDKFPYQVSGGQKQRCACARAMIHRPKLILADEPTGALDYHTSKEILKLIETVNQRYGNTIIMVTHNDAIKDMADRVVKLRDGMIRKNYRNEVKIPAINLEW